MSYVNGDNGAITVSAVNQYIKAIFDQNDILSGICVRGEISNLKYHSSGHLYFSLKDDGGLLRAVMFRSAASQMKINLQNGMKVLAYGSISVFVRDGQYQLYATHITPDGVGALYQAYEELKNRLAAEGLFDQQRKKPIPRYPEKIGVITSATGAAVQDIMQILARRYPLAHIYLRPSEVQGVNAPQSLVSALRFFENEFPVDVIIIGRGGGSIEDLWAFNDEVLAYSIASCTTPIISAVGHETDFTICDFVADLRAPTPSAAAELAVPDIEDLHAGVENMRQRLVFATKKKLVLSRQNLMQTIARSALQRPEQLTRDRRLSLDLFETQMQRAYQDRLTSLKTSIDKIAIKLTALHPKQILQRGFCMVSKDGKPISKAEQLSPQDSISLHFSDGSLSATIFDTSTSNK